MKQIVIKIYQISSNLKPISLQNDKCFVPRPIIKIE